MKGFGNIKRKAMIALLVVAMMVGTLSAMSQAKGASSTDERFVTIAFCGGTFANLATTYMVTSAKAPDYKLKLEAKYFTREGYKFEGLTEDSKAKSATYKPGSDGYVYLTLNKEKTLYCVWNPNQYLITCQKKMPFGIKMVIGFVPANYGSFIVDNPNLPKPDKGYTRTWYYASNNEKVVMSNCRLTGNVTIYAEDNPNTLSVQCYVDGKKTGKKAVKTGQVLNDILSAPAKDGYRFLGWSPYANGRNPETNEITVYSPSYVCLSEKEYESVKYYAQYLKVGETKYVNYIMESKELNALHEEYTRMYQKYKNDYTKLKKAAENKTLKVIKTFFEEFPGVSTLFAVAGIGDASDYRNLINYYNSLDAKEEAKSIECLIDKKGKKYSIVVRTKTTATENIDRLLHIID